MSAPARPPAPAIPRSSGTDRPGSARSGSIPICFRDRDAAGRRRRTGGGRSRCSSGSRDNRRSKDGCAANVASAADTRCPAVPSGSNGPPTFPNLCRQPGAPNLGTCNEIPRGAMDLDLIRPVGQITRNLSSPFEKNISVLQKGKSVYMICHPVPPRGVAQRQQRGAGCDGRDSVGRARDRRAD